MSEVGNIYKEDKIAQQKHSPHGKKRGADATTFGVPLVTQVVRLYMLVGCVVANDFELVESK